MLYFSLFTGLNLTDVNLSKIIVNAKTSNDNYH